MPDAAASLLSSLAEHGAAAHLRSLGRDAAVLGDEASLPLLATLAPAARGPWPVDAPPAGALDGVRSLVVWSRHEAEHTAALRRRYPGTGVHGLAGDLLPRLAAGRPIDAPIEPAAHGYVILCTPRSGSYHLCALLAALGFGQPDEHLDQGLCEAARLGLLDLRAHLDALRGLAVAHGWFGTKLIAHALFAAFDSGLPAADFLAWLQQHRLRVLHLVRDDKVAQAVSNYFARHTGVWTATTPGAPPPRPPYDFAAIRADWHELRQQEEWLELFVRHLPAPPLRLRYEDLDHDPAAVLAAVAAFLTDGGAPPLPFRVQPGTRKQRDALSTDYAARFARDLAAGGS
ncbi:MAG: hypothetical protein KF830_13780 [Planctomycetes bacterium]|nr:hypothetical protein [Planctomycetota bacterium]